MKYPARLCSTTNDRHKVWAFVISTTLIMVATRILLFLMRLLLIPRNLGKHRCQGLPLHFSKSTEVINIFCTVARDQNKRNCRSGKHIGKTHGLSEGDGNADQILPVTCYPNVGDRHQPSMIRVAKISKVVLPQAINKSIPISADTSNQSRVVPLAAHVPFPLALCRIHLLV